MAKKILIAMDESENSKRAVEFVGGNFDTRSSVTLFSVLQNTETMCAMQAPELTPYFVAQQTSFCTLEDKKKELVAEAMEKAKKVLVKKGFAANRVDVKLVKRKKGVARVIISEARTGKYDLVVMGKKGLSGVREFLFGSITQKVLHGVKNASVLLVD
ncbi:universal stress protein [Desulfosudis oleivorans]|uniref:UspA domain protein n=1 Tax=Desulfosudis oleivorans (strain DSM 6200 / JCM 39069 / Hxd3) TaxID=96561 RepID=A8ZSQ6_DESOH|nr:universal stress protein [Desulfosudis oleivorans]ABW65969.1 UspA domain protein [Desulfosudis oleivorans Hxd3]